MWSVGTSSTVHSSHHALSHWLSWLSKVLTSNSGIVWLLWRARWVSSLSSVGAISCISVGSSVIFGVASLIDTLWTLSITTFEFLTSCIFFEWITIFLLVWSRESIFLGCLFTATTNCWLIHSRSGGSWKKVTVCINQGRKLDEMLVNWIIIHALFKWPGRNRWEGGIWIGHLENDIVNFFEAAEWVYWTSISFRSLEEIFSSGILPLIRILSWSTSSSATCWRVSQFTIRTLGMLLLHMSVKCGIRQVGFVAVLTLEISSGVVVFWASLSTLLCVIMVVVIRTIFRISTILALFVILLLLIFHISSFLNSI